MFRAGNKEFHGVISLDGVLDTIGSQGKRKGGGRWSMVMKGRDPERPVAFAIVCKNSVTELQSQDRLLMFLIYCRSSVTRE
jgi:hypothetical protein